MNRKRENLVNVLKDAFSKEIPLATSHKNISLDDAHELMKLYRSAQKEAIYRLGLDKVPRRIAERQLPKGLRSFSEFVQLAYTTLNLETRAHELMRNPYLTKIDPRAKADLRKITGYEKFLHGVLYNKLSGRVQTKKPD